MAQVNCLVCGNEFYAKPSWIRRGYGKFCSRECTYKNQRNGNVVKCSVCGKAVYRSQNHLLNKSKSGEFFCSKSCQTIWRNTVFSVENHPNWKTGRHVYRDILNRSKPKESCAKCGTRDTRVLAVHYRDKNRTNNNVPNLEWLCYNCHFLVHHYVSEAKGFLDI